MAEIVMPRLSDTMEEGTILRWLKRDGEYVRRGEELVEIETDKAAMVYESDVEGVLEIAAGEGDTLAVGATIAHVGEVESAEDEEARRGAVAEEDREAQPSTVAEEGRGAQPIVLAAETAEPPSLQPSAAATSSPEPPSPTPLHGQTEDRGGERVRASPVARRVARERGVDLRGMAGSGPGGRIVKADVEAGAKGTMPIKGDMPTKEEMPAKGAAPEPATLAERVTTAKGETTVVELTRTQQTIARRMAESKATIPDFSLQMDIDMEACVALRAELKRLSPEAAPTYNDMVVKACALALREYPRANGSYRDGRLQLHSRVNVGVAVATDDALVVPTVFDADLKSLGEIARETRALAERVRASTITPPELGGGTFTVSNLGMYGVRSFTAIVNPPQAAILSVGSLAPRAVVSEGAGGQAGSSRQDEPAKIVLRHTLAVTLVCDHRVLYGADAARFLARVRELLEEPAALAL